jgi:hypothetical protein
VRFEEAAPLKRPSRKAGVEAWQEYKRMNKLHNLSQRWVQSVAPLRQALDEAGGITKLLVRALDGSFCNRICFRAPRDRTELIARAQAYHPLPKWRRKAHRPSCLDLVTLPRKEMVDCPDCPQSLGFQLTDRNLTHAADA